MDIVDTCINEIRNCPYMPLVFATCFFYMFMVAFVNPMLSQLLCVPYRNLPPAKQVDWCTRINSNINALVLCICCVWAYIEDGDVLYNNAVLGDSHIVKTAGALIMGYTLADLMVVFRYWSLIGEIGYVLHHVSTLFAFMTAVTQTWFLYYANFRLVAEFSTVFVNNRWYLDAIKYDRKSVLFFSNGVSMTIVFFMVRVAVMPYYWLRVFAWVGHPSWVSTGWWGPIVIIGSCAVLDVVNLFWMVKMVRGTVRALKVMMGDRGGDRRKQGDVTDSRTTDESFVSTVTSGTSGAPRDGPDVSQSQTQSQAGGVHKRRMVAET